MVGKVDNKMFVTKVLGGTDPLQWFHHDKLEEMIELDYDTEEEIEDTYDISDVTLESEGNVTLAELKSLLQNI